MVREIPLTKGQVALVDDDDFERVTKHSWQAIPINKKAVGWYAKSSKAVDGKKRSFYLHRLIIGAVPGQIVDHINSDTLDCRRDNLRFVSPTQNSINCRKQVGRRFKGITQDRGSTRWRAEIYVNYVRIRLGSFGTEEQAALAYDDAARRLFGEFARLNFPLDGEQAA